MGISLLDLIGFRLGVLLLLMVGVVGEGYGQRVYATNYGAVESGDGLDLLGIPILSAGKVRLPESAIGNTLNISELYIGGVVGHAFARLQLKFINSNLPRGTSIFIRIDGNTSQGLLGLLLASNGFLSAQRNAEVGNSDIITGSQIALNDNDVENIIINGSRYLKITPKECFNAIAIALTSDGLLGLLSFASLKIYHAYYECPEILLAPVEPICHSESAILQIRDPFSITCGQEYLWYEQATGGSALPNAGLISTQYTTTPLTATKTSMQKTYWVEYTGVDNSICCRTPVTVTIHPKPSKIHIEAY